MLEQQDFINALADILRQARRDKKYTLDKLAEKSDADYSTVSLIENGKQNPKIYTVYKILYALDIDIIKLFNNKADELKDSKLSILNKLGNLDTDTLESVSNFLDGFNISNKQ